MHLSGDELYRYYRCGCTIFELANIKCILVGMNFIDIIDVEKLGHQMPLISPGLSISFLVI
jgi:hypothetical protein